MSWWKKLFRGETSGKSSPAKGSAVPESSGRKIVDDLIATLKTGDEKARANAAVRLYEHPCDASVKALSQALKDSSAEVVANAAESLRVMAVIGECRIDPKPLLEALKTQPNLASLKACLRELGLQHEVDKITEQQFPAAAKYTALCMPFACPHCGFQIAKVPSWPTRGNSVPFYAQTGLQRSGAYNIEFACAACNKTVYVVWDDDPR